MFLHEHVRRLRQRHMSIRDINIFGTYFSGMEQDRHRASSNALFADASARSVSASEIHNAGIAGGDGMFDVVD